MRVVEQVRRIRQVQVGRPVGRAQGRVGHQLHTQAGHRGAELLLLEANVAFDLNVE